MVSKKINKKETQDNTMKFENHTIPPSAHIVKKKKEDLKNRKRLHP